MKQIHLALTGLLAILWGLAGCSILPSPQVQTTWLDPGHEESRSSFVHRFKWTKCEPLDLPLEIDCGYFVVPADHNNPQKGKMRLSVTIIRAQAKEIAPDPVVFLAGGPGISATDGIASWIDQPFLKKRDLILIDLRGSGASSPSLNCPEVESNPGKKDSVEACYNRLVSADVDLTLFNSAQMTADLNALRQTLQYEQWNVLGISSGTRLALALVRDYPQGIRSLILDSTYPPEVNAFETKAVNGLRALQAVFQSCMRNAQCAFAYPDLEHLFYDLLTSLDNKPVTVTIANPFGGQQQEIYLDGHVMATLVYEALYQEETLARIPYVIYEAHYGRNQAIAGLIFPRTQTSYYPSLHSGEKKGLAESEGAYFSIECQDEVGFNRLDAARSAARETGSAFAQLLIKDVEEVFSICSFWQPRSASPVENEAVASSIPTLILGGQYDPVTPPEWGRQTATNLANSYTYIFPGLGHAVLETGRCPQEIAAAFLKNPQQEPDSDCMGRMKLEFWLP